MATALAELPGSSHRTGARGPEQAQYLRAILSRIGRRHLTMTRQPLYLAGRIVFAGFFLVTSLYCLLAFIPFTYQQMVKAHLLPALSQFAELHPALHVVILATVLLLLCFDRQAAVQVPRVGRRIRLCLLIYVAVESGDRRT